jgi:hypothetical protein
MIDSTSWDIEIQVWINFPSYKRNPVHSTSPFIVKNRTTPLSSGDSSPQSSVSGGER